MATISKVAANALEITFDSCGWHGGHQRRR